MIDAIKEKLQEIEEFAIDSQDRLEEFKRRFNGKQSEVRALFGRLKEVPNEQKREMGAALNELAQKAEAKWKSAASGLVQKKSKASTNSVDLTLPSYPHELGTRHPLSLTLAEIVRIFERIGFNISEGPEIEDDWHNFSALNFPENHPAREMQDTFFIEKNPDMLLRTHTSSVQVRVMENEKPPIRTLSPGRVYRNEAISARAHCVFHQVEGLYIDKDVSFLDLKETLAYFVKELFGPKTKMRFRPSYFPFTEPSAEVDISCFICHGDGCNICKKTGWVEIGGSGMVDPNVLKSANIDPEEYSGFAFGMGIERITMLKYQINDLRLFTENDVRFLRQFKGII